ncbi:MAG: hypothetical protein K5682_06800 [Lachnospiraceae bacterium]|nr:hypothetical protein [Lachnospiraceae bacterium]
MKTLWTYINSKKWKTPNKYRFIFFISGFTGAFAGFVLWLVIHIWALSTLDWMLCFIGYPILLSLFWVYIYTSNHPFYES